MNLSENRTRRSVERACALVGEVKTFSDGREMQAIHKNISFTDKYHPPKPKGAKEKK
jgi:hypothetical protein